MEQRALGRTGLTVSALGFGCGSVGGLMVRGDPVEQTRAVARALEAGITYFDTAPLYGDGRSEENLGRALRELGAWERVTVGTKFRLTPADLADPVAAIRRSLEASLRRLGRDYVDLLQLHNSVELEQSERGLRVEDVTGAVSRGLMRLSLDGLVRHAGFTGLGDAAALTEVARSRKFETVQGYVNAVNPSAAFAGASGGAQDFAGLIGEAAGAGLGVIAIRVLAAGALAGDAPIHANAQTGGSGGALAGGGDFLADQARSRSLAPLAAELGVESPMELSLRLALAVPGVSTALVGYSDLTQLEMAIRWAERGPLPEDAVRRVVEAARTAA